MFKIIFFCPLEHTEKVKNALFKIGAGKIGNYQESCFVTKVVGQFRPIIGAKPSIGQIDKLEYVDEYKVEMVCEDELINIAIKSLKESHPYEEPAYEVYKIETYGL
ncbi:hypothetical protein ACTFIZ_012387 [Dictyostelium cf. discoideum]